MELAENSHKQSSMPGQGNQTLKLFSMQKVMPLGYDRLINLSIISLALYGIFMVGSASMGLNIGNSAHLIIDVLKQVIFAALGLIAMIWLANHFRLEMLKRKEFLHIIFLTIGSLLFCLAFAPVGGAKAWIRLPVSFAEISIQPSEFAKITVILIVAAYCGTIKQKFSSGWAMVKRPIWFIVAICFIVLVLQGDFGSMAVILVIAFQCFQIPSHKQMRPYQNISMVFFAIILGGAIYALSPSGAKIIQNLPFLQEYQRNRFLSAVDPFYDRYSTGFQLIKGLISFATGGWFGKGFGYSINKYSQFPAANTDYILSILVEEVGYVGFLVLMALYGIIIVRCYQYAFRCRNDSARIILVGNATYLLVHMLFNIGGVTGMIPLTGVPLLMISAGGSSTMAFMMMVGISQAVISAYNRKEI